MEDALGEALEYLRKIGRSFSRIVGNSPPNVPVNDPIKRLDRVGDRLQDIGSSPVLGFLANPDGAGEVSQHSCCLSVSEAFLG